MLNLTLLVRDPHIYHICSTAEDLDLWVKSHIVLEENIIGILSVYLVSLLLVPCSERNLLFCMKDKKLYNIVLHNRRALADPCIRAPLRNLFGVFITVVVF